MKRSILVALLVLPVLQLAAQSFDPVRRFPERAAALSSEARNVRRELHRIPELCFQETKTAAFVKEYLEKLGLEVHTGIGGNGMKAVLRGTRPTPVIAIRADMDALPIAEATGLPFASTHGGVMHACGHDVHMTNVLLAARLLSEVRAELPGTVVFLFQPCEEGAPGGAKSGAERMIDDGALENPRVDAMIGLHLLPQLPLGRIALGPGAVMANVASVYLTIQGKSAHGALPHQGVDAVYAAAQAVVQFQGLISRRKNPAEQAVLTIGKINGGVRLNVIAEEVTMEGTVRTFSNETQNLVQEGMERILKGLELSLGIRYTFQFLPINRFVKNDRALSAFFRPLFAAMLGEAEVVDQEPLTIGEDYAAYSHRLPAVFFFLGTGRSVALHTPQFDIDEALLQSAPALFAAAAWHYLEAPPAAGK